jgi:hypothetical protein
MGTLAIAGIVVGSIFAYIVIGGVVWHLVPRRWDEPSRDLGSAVWPLLPFIVGAWQLAKLLAVRVPRWIVARAKRSNLPRAEVRKW